jgi:hypothetical protein
VLGTGAFDAPVASVWHHTHLASLPPPGIDLFGERDPYIRFGTKRRQAP